MCVMSSESFNRTFMELKLRQNRQLDSFHHGFNRTFMELKLGTSRMMAMRKLVLIGPSWN